MSEVEKWAKLVQEFKESRKSQRVWSAENGVKRSHCGIEPADRTVENWSSNHVC